MIVYTIKTITIDLGYSRNVFVKYKPLPFQTDGYIFESLSRINIPKGLLTSTFKNILRGDKHPIPFSNLNIISVRVYEDAIIGYLSECNMKPKYYIKVYLKY